ncbi:MAG: hypothetical protein VST71_06610 [Nitrospirota bacterium]|nr:hypothetical protein [Nitrospirota bacterium]
MNNKDKEVISELNHRLAEYRKTGYNIPGISTLVVKPPHLAPVIKIVHIDTSYHSKDIYPVGGGKYAFSRDGIQKFRIAGGIEFVGHPGGDYVPIRNGILVRAMGRRFDPDGNTKIEVDGKMIDLEAREEDKRLTSRKKIDQEHKDWSEEKKRRRVEESTKNYILSQNKFKYEIALTGAQSRVVSKLLGLKSTYTLEELKRPFVIVAMVPDWDKNDPEIKRMVTARMLGFSEQLYPNTSRPNNDPAPDCAAPPVFYPEESDRDTAHTGSSNSENLVEEDFIDYPRAFQVRIIKKIIDLRNIPADTFPIDSLDSRELMELFNKLKQGEIHAHSNSF